MERVENYASLTIPKIMLPDGFNVESTDQTHDYQSLGAQAVNHTTNKIMLAMFAPSRPFFRVQPGQNTKAKLKKVGIAEEDLGTVFAEMERNAVKKLDSLAQRPKLYAAIRNLIVTGNVLVTREKETLRTQGLRYYCVKRTITGKIHTLVIREEVEVNELDVKVQQALPPGKYKDDGKCEFFKLILRQPNGDYTLSQWVDETRLPKEFDGKYTEKTLPYHALTWDLADESDYGTGLVEEYVGDFEALSSLSESVVDGAILGTEFRWMANPAGMTSVQDVQDSKNGDVLPGTPQDVAPTQGGNPQAVQVALTVLQGYEQRISRGFLMLTGVTRDAERVTAEEIRQVAQELETAFGGVYSALSASLQSPVALWLLEMADTPIAGTDLELQVITGLDALSRNGDLEAFRLAMNDLGLIMQLPPALQARLKMDKITQFVGDGRGIDLRPYIKSDAEFSEEQDANNAAIAEQAAAQSAGETAGQGIAQ
jgi:hypothetical protein